MELAKLLCLHLLDKIKPPPHLVQIRDFLMVLAMVWQGYLVACLQIHLRLKIAAVRNKHMPRFSPARKLPPVIGLFAVASPFVVLLAASLRAYKRSWPADALLDLFGVVFIAVAVSSLLVVEVMRQRKSEISDDGFFVSEWCLSRRFPFFSNVQNRYRWSDVEDIGRNGYTLIFKTQAGRKRINLFGFDRPEDVALFAIEQWRSQRSAYF
jgi:hypothetical protein